MYCCLLSNITCFIIVLYCIFIDYAQGRKSTIQK